MKITPREDWQGAPPSRPLGHKTPGYNKHGWVLHWPGPYSAIAKTGDWKKELDSYRRYHQKTKGWKFLAYNFAVDPDGGLWEGRGFDSANAANRGANGTTYSVLFLGTGQHGDKSETGPTHAALSAVAWLIKQHPGNGVIRSHKEVKGGTECAGKLVTAQIPTIKNMVAAPKAKPAPVAAKPAVAPKQTPLRKALGSGSALGTVAGELVLRGYDKAGGVHVPGALYWASVIDEKPDSVDHAEFVLKTQYGQLGAPF